MVRHYEFIFNVCATPLKKRYGLHLQQQNEILDEVYTLIYTMRCISKNTLLTFQKGKLMSIQSLKLLYKDLQNKYEMHYIITNRLNQDSLENLFSQIRTGGGLHDHPSPLNARYRIRMIILGKNPGTVQGHTNTQMTSDEFISTKMLTLSEIEVSTAELNNDIEHPKSDIESLMSSSGCEVGTLESFDNIS